MAAAAANAETPLVILGAGPPYRGRTPSSLVQTPARGRVLDWQLRAYAASVGGPAVFVGGYGFEDVVRAYPDIDAVLNAEWQSGGSAGSLLTGLPRGPKSCFVAYADIVAAPAVFEAVAATAGDVVVAVDRAWRRRYERRASGDVAGAEKVLLDGARLGSISTSIPDDEADGEFVGVLYLRAAALQALHALPSDTAARLRTGGLPQLLNWLIEGGMEIGAAGVDGQWAELNAPQDLARFVLGSKAETLDTLRPLLRRAEIGAQVRFTVAQWRQERETVLARIVETFAEPRLIVRSSAIAEDGWQNSAAGQYLSVPNVPRLDAERLAASIDDVASSYGDTGEGNQIFVQAMADDIAVSGVVLTRTLNSGAPYLTINYDDVTGGTDSVTSGLTDSHATVVLHHSAQSLPDDVPPSLAAVRLAVEEIAELLGHDSLDIEFAVAGGGAVQIFQTRPLVAPHRAGHFADEDIDRVLAHAAAALEETQRPVPGVAGSGTVFGLMPDWNPAEIIGTKPRALAAGLYQFLVTDETWAEQRLAYGYRDVRSTPLMRFFAGQPYIDVRASLNSFVPAGLDDDLARRLVDASLARLIANPQWHDKLEFEVAFTAWPVDFDDRAAWLRDAGFSAVELAEFGAALRRVTAAGIARLGDDLAMLNELEQRAQAVLSSELAPLEQAFRLLAHCRRWGVLPFAHLARGAFVSMTLLRSGVAAGHVSEDAVGRFLESIRTVSHGLAADGAAVAAGRLAWSDYVARYGHLRPGTYDIASPRYDSDPECFLRPLAATAVAVDADGRGNDAELARALAVGLGRSGLDVSAQELAPFLRRSIEGRELAKFRFSRYLSAALECIAAFGADLGLDRDDLAHLRLDDLATVRDGRCLEEPSSWLSARAADGRRQHEITSAVELPALLCRPQDVYGFRQQAMEPNYITQKTVTAAPLLLEAREGIATAELAGRIVCIRQADPGYDWIFGRGIAGLVTAYGGANSHMAIRAAEFGLPAAIGIGETALEGLRGAGMLTLDCLGRRLVAPR